MCRICLKIGNSGNLSLKASDNAPGNILFVKSDNTQLANIYSSTNGLYLSTSTNNTPAISINANGNVGICGAPYSTYGLTVGSSTNMVNTYFYGGITRFYNYPVNVDLIIDNTSTDHGENVHSSMNNSGNIGNSAYAFEYMYSYHFTNPSDRRQKENIRSITGALDLVLKLTGVRYDLKKQYALSSNI